MRGPHWELIVFTNLNTTVNISGYVLAPRCDVTGTSWTFTQTLYKVKFVQPARRKTDGQTIFLKWRP